MAANPDRLDLAREVVCRALAGEIDADSPEYLDDVLYFSVRHLESNEPEWLAQVLRDPRFTTTRRRLVVSAMASPLQQTILNELDTLNQQRSTSGDY